MSTTMPASASAASAGPSTAKRLLSWRKRIDWSIKETRKTRNPPYVQLATVDEQGLPRVRTIVFRGFLDSSNTGGGGGTTIADRDTMRFITDARSEKVAHIQKQPLVELNWWFPGSSEQYRVFGRCELLSFSEAFSVDSVSAGEAGQEDATNARRKEMVRKQWHELKDAAREQFFWDQPGVNFSGLDYSKAKKWDYERGGADGGGGGKQDQDEVRGAPAVSPGPEEQDPASGPVGEDGHQIVVEDQNTATTSAAVNKIPVGGRDTASGKILDPPDAFLLLLLRPQEVKYLRLKDNLATFCKLDSETGSWITDRVNP